MAGTLAGDVSGHTQVSFAGGQAPVLLVRKVTGDVVLSLSRTETTELVSVQALRAEVGKAVARRSEEVVLIAGVQQLQDLDSLEALLAEGTLQEVVMAIQQGPQFDPSADPLTQLPALKWMLLSSQPHEQLDAAIHYRRILSVERNPPNSLIIEQGIVPRLLELCEAEDPELQFEAAWALTNIASGTAEETRVVAADGLPVFVRLLQASSKDVREQAAWALGNIAGTSPQMRDQVLQASAMQPLLGLLGEELSLRFLRQAVWTLSNLCRGKPPPDLAAVAPALKTLARAIMSTDAEVITETAWALSYIADCSNEGVAAVLDSEVLARCVELLLHDSPEVVTPALRAVLNVVSGGDDNQKQRVLSAGVLPKLRALMNHTKGGIRAESYRVISRLLATGEAQIQEVINAGIVPPLLQSLKGEYYLPKVEVAKALQSATSRSSAEQIQHLVEAGCIPAMIAALGVSHGIDEQLASPLLRSLENILKAGERLSTAEGQGSGPWVALARAEGLEVVERWAASCGEEASQTAQTLLTQFQALAPRPAKKVKT